MVSHKNQIGSVYIVKKDGQGKITLVACWHLIDGK